MRIKRIKPLKLFHVEFIDCVEACLTMLRPQEFYESPKFRGRTFTTEEYIEWYCRQQKEQPFDYMVEIAGYNVPGNAFLKWYNGTERLTKHESVLIYKLVKAGAFSKSDPEDDFYIIGTVRGVKDLQQYLAHEIRHALFYLLPEYRDGILEVLSRFPCKRFRRKLLNDKTVNYCEAVLDDEVQAYALTGFDPYYECKITELPQELQDLRKELKKVERRFIKKGKIHVPRYS